MYHHTTQDQATLDAMTPEEKEKRMSLTDIRIRAWQSAREYKYRIVVPNDYPYEWMEESLVCWYKRKKDYPHEFALVEKWFIEKEYQYTHKALRNEVKAMSCPSRFHFHLIKH